MVDEKGVEAASGVNIKVSASSWPGLRVCYFNGVAHVEHPEFGVVTMRFESRANLDSPGSIEERKINFRAFVERCVKSIEAATREG